MVEKTYVKSRQVYKVTFEVPEEQLPAEMDVESLAVAGDFNDWNPTAVPMKLLKRGAYKTSVDFEPGSGPQRFRYVANGETWLNDWNAEAYAPNAHGSDDCIVTIPDAPADA